MFDQPQLDRLLQAMRANGVTRLEVRISASGERLRLVLPPAAKALAAAASPAAPRQSARSPGIGTFLARGADDGLPPFADGAAVTAGEVLGYVCHGSARVPISTPAAGTLSGDAPTDGTLLGYGDTIFIVELPA